MSLQDTYNDSQAENTTLLSGSWTPASSRQTFEFVTVGGGSLNIFSNISFFPRGIRYTFDSPQDFSNFANISVDVKAFSGNAQMWITLNSEFASDSYQITTTGSYIWTMSQFVGVDLTNVVSLTIAVVPQSEIFEINIESLTSTFVCLARDTNILMEDGSEKKIQDIIRGDIVRGDSKGDKNHKVARLNILPVDGTTRVDMVEIEPHSLGVYYPHTKTLISQNHPILYDGKRKPAKCFCNWKGITQHTGENAIAAKDILPADEQGRYFVYDLQFDHEGTYIANGMIVQSRSPYSDITSLPKDLYFDLENYKDVKTWDTINHPYPLDLEPLDGKHEKGEK